jgi:hypothetical protein
MRRPLPLLIATLLGLSAGPASAVHHPKLLSRLLDQDYNKDEVLRVCGAPRPGEEPPAQAGSPTPVEQLTRGQPCGDKEERGFTDKWSVLMDAEYGPPSKAVWLMDKRNTRVSDKLTSSGKIAPKASSPTEQASGDPSTPTAPSLEQGKESSGANWSLQSKCTGLATSLRYEEQSYKNNSKKAEIASLNANRFCKGTNRDDSCQSQLQEAQIQNQLALENLNNAEAIRKKMIDLGCSAR